MIAVNPLVDAAGRSIVIRAQVRNQDTALRPGHVRARAPHHQGRAATRWSCPSRRWCRRATSSSCSGSSTARRRASRSRSASAATARSRSCSGVDAGRRRRHRRPAQAARRRAGRRRRRAATGRASRDAPAPDAQARPMTTGRRAIAPAEARSRARLRTRPTGALEEHAMTLPEICIKRPVFATVLSLVILLVGAHLVHAAVGARVPAHRRAGRQRQHAPTAAPRPRSSSRRSRRSLEDSLSGIEGVEMMTSQSRSERSQINVRFKLSRDPDSAAADVRDKVSRVRGQAAGRRSTSR